MEFLKLEIDNFLTVKQASLRLSNRGLSLLQGENLDDPSATSNGAGKSSIVDALSWVLFGETARGASGDSIINRTAKKGCRVRVVIQDGDTVYGIARHRKDSTWKNALTVDAWGGESLYAAHAPATKLTKGTDKETQEVVLGILGCTLDVFKASIYAGQENMPDLPGMTDKNLKVLIEEAAGVERLEAAYRVAREKALLKTNELNRAEDLLNRTHAQIQALEARAANLEEASSNFESGRDGRVASALEAAKVLEDSIRRRFADLGAVNVEAITAEIAENQVALDSNRQHSAKLSELRAVENTAGLALSRQQAVVDRAADDARRSIQALKNAPAEMAKPCPECGKPHTDDELAEFTKHLEKRRQDALVTLKGAKDALEPLSRGHQTALEARQVYESGIPDLRDVANALSALQAKLREVEAIKGQLRVLKKDYDAAKLRAENERTATNPHAAAIELVGVDGEALIKQNHDQSGTLESLRWDQEVLDAVVKVFGPAGVRAHVLDTVTPFLNARTADYLSTLSDGNIAATWTTLAKNAKGELRERFNIDVTNAHGGEEFCLQSGGEKRKVRLATMLALQDLVASRATKPINIWIADEIDQALDSAGLERLMVVLERRAREKGTVIVISHNSLTDWIDDVTVVTKKDGLSTVSGALL